MPNGLKITDTIRKILIFDAALHLKNAFSCGLWPSLNHFPLMREEAAGVKPAASSFWLACAG